MNFRLIHKGLTCIFVLLLGTVFSQKWEEVPSGVFKDVLLKCGKQTSKQNYFIEFNRQVYANGADATPVSSTSGKFFRGKGKEYRVESENQLLIQTDEIKMVIDSAEKLILLMKPDTLFNAINPQELFVGEDFTTSKFFWKQSGKLHTYRISFQEGHPMYQNVDLSLDPKTNEILRVELKLISANYLSNDFEDQTKEEPLIVMEYKPAADLNKPGSFDVNHWIVKRSGDKYELQPQIEFTLDDLRIN